MLFKVMGLKNFEILLDKKINLFNPGEKITGNVNFTTDAPKKIKGVRVCFRGAAHTEFCEDEINKKKLDHKKKLKRKFYSADEEYFHIKFYIFGGDKSAGIDLEIGEHSYPFQFQLPHFIPSSFEGVHGSIRYSITAILERPWKFDHETRLEFSVYSPLDLNHLENVKQPVNECLEKRFGFFCWTTEPLKVNVKLPVTGFVPGQTIVISGNLENNSNIDVDYISFTLRRVTRFRATYPNRNSKEVKEEIIHSINEPEGKEGTFQQIMLLPLTPAAIHLHNCNIMDIHHEIKVKIQMHGAALLKSNVKKCIPITIGTFQLENHNAVCNNQNKIFPPQYFQHLEIPELRFFTPANSTNCNELEEPLRELIMKNSKSAPNFTKPPSVTKTSAHRISQSPSPTPSSLWDLKGDGMNSLVPPETMSASQQFKPSDMDYTRLKGSQELAGFQTCIFQPMAPCLGVE